MPDDALILNENALLHVETPLNGQTAQPSAPQAQNIGVLPSKRNRTFNKANAAHYARLAIEARAKNRLVAQYHKEQHAQDMLKADKAKVANCPSFTELRLMRVRKQLDRLDDMMFKEKDPQKLDRLASAQARLSEQERILDGRPLPGSRRPRPEKPTKDTSTVEPVD